MQLRTKHCILATVVRLRTMRCKDLFLGKQGSRYIEKLLHLVISKKLGQVFLARLQKYSQVASVYHL